MHSRKDMPHSTASHSKSVKKIPIILKQRPKQNSAVHQDISKSKAFYETPFGTFLNPRPEKSVEILFLNQSDLVDESVDVLSTGKSTVTIIENSVPKETPIKEIVIDKSQIFHLLPVPKRMSDPKSNTSQVIKKDDSKLQKVNQNGNVTQNINPETLQKVNQRFETPNKYGNKVEFIQDVRNKLGTVQKIEPNTYINRNRGKTGDNNSQVARNVINGAQVVPNISKRVANVSSIDDDVVIVSDDEDSQAAYDNTLTDTYLTEIEENTTKTDENVKPSRPESPTLPVSICRTCLKPVASSACHKLYDNGKLYRTAHELRQRLSEVADFIDLQASLNPMVCTECCETIHAAYNFRRRLKSVEGQINRRKNGTVSVVDLKTVLEEVAQEKLGTRKKVKDHDVRKVETVNLDEYLEKRKQIIDQYVTDLVEEAPPQKRWHRMSKSDRNEEPTSPAQAFKTFTKPKVLVNNNLRTTEPDSSIKMLENILANSKNGHAIIEIVNDEERPDTAIYSSPSQKLERHTRDTGTSVSNLQNTVPSLGSTVPSQGTVVPSQDTMVLDQEVSESNLETPAPSSGTFTTMTVVPSPESLVSVGNIASFTTNTQYSTPSLDSQSMEPMFIAMEPLTLPQMSLIPNLQTLVPNLTLLVTSDESRTQSLDSPIVSMDCPASFEVIQEPVKDLQVAKTNGQVTSNVPGISKTNSPPKDGTREVTLDEFLKFRQKKLQKLKDVKDVQEENANGQVTSNVAGISKTNSPRKGGTRDVSLDEFLKFRKKKLMGVNDVQEANADGQVTSNVSEISKTNSPQKDGMREVSLEEFLKFRQKKFEKLTGEKEGKMAGEPQNAQEKVPNLLAELAEEKKKRSEDIYNYVSKATGSRKKKPTVPKTWDLFDDEHDKYFEELRGEASFLMRRKWTRFTRRPQGGGPPYLCDICGKFFPDRASLKQHRDNHTGSDLTICSYCGIKVRSHRFKEHVALRHKPPGFECEECGEKFPLNHMLRRHVVVAHRNPIRRCTCQVCGVALRRREMGVHMRSHNDEWKFCDVCQKVLPNHAKWLAHRRHHFRKVYTCPVCSKAVTSAHNLKQHVRKFHEDKDARCCSLCGKFMSRCQSLTRHMRTVHGWKPRTRQKPEERVPQETPPEIREDEVERAVDFIATTLNDMPDSLMELRDELTYDDVMNTPMDVEEIIVPFGSVDDLFPVD